MFDPDLVDMLLDAQPRGGDRKSFPEQPAKRLRYALARRSASIYSKNGKYSMSKEADPRGPRRRSSAGWSDG